MIFVMVKSLAVSSPLVNFFLAFLLQPPYLGYLLVKSFKLFESLSLLQSIPIRFLSGLSAAVAFTPTYYAAVTISLIEIFIGLLAFQKLLTSVQNQINQNEVVDTVRKFRQLQIVIQSYNNLYMTTFFEYGLSISYITVIIFGYCTIKLRKEISIFGVMCFLNVTVMGLFLIFVTFTIASRVWVESGFLIQKLNEKSRVGRNRFQRKTVASCVPLKIRIGSVNFVDRATAGVIVSFIVEQISSLSMLKP
jgi:hypothetical protein